jgi:hypothetical protein
MPPFLSDVLPFWPYAAVFAAGILIEKIAPWVGAKLKALGGGVASKVTELEQHTVSHAAAISANAKSIFNLNDTLTRTQAQISGVANDALARAQGHDKSFAELFGRVSQLEAVLANKITSA